ncbi:ketopantoate reductase family protein [Bosea sp. (in: a-proteobacteria)]|uniref:ketopantoate reductase family protein n=1 Tax=Bosea sp. (in: a-proteobacteria) TaxID=1871050 RepID=UPI001218F626|nr:ketopantoate reductase family protein [Bosea sp. (in: a-proteobacteria)]TAJ31915.1 MAG: ketopantoate reductase family protein [Bosea sp. (in: a-proteobacteria)]
MSEPILIWGAGAIGGTLGAYWARAGVPVLMVDIVPGHVEACRTSGLSISGPVEEFRQVVPAVTPQELTGTYSRIVLAVKAGATEAALAQLKPHLAEGGFVLSAQNGLNELAIAAEVGAARTMGCFVNFGADWLGDGEILYGNRGAVVVGELDGGRTDRVAEMHRLLKLFDPDSILTDNIFGYLWGKLAYGAMLFGTALTEDSMSANFADPQRLPVWLALGREVGAVAAARGVTSLGFGRFDPMVFAPGAPEGPQIETIRWLADYTSQTAKTHSGIWRDLAVRKRKTEVDPQIGVIATLGREAGVATPVIETLVSLIHDIEEGRRPMAFETLKALIDTCTTASTAA